MEEPLDASTRQDPPPRKTGRARRGVLVAALSLAALGAGAWVLTHGNGGSASKARNRRPVAAVGTATAKLGDIPINIEALGTVTPLAQVAVQPQVSGVITQILYREGQMVPKGATLAVIDPRPFELALQQAQAALARDEAQLQIAQVTLQRYQTLEKTDSVAGQDVDTQAATVKQLAGTVAGDRATVGSAKLSLIFSRIAAPVAGRVGLRTADVGSYVTPASANGIVTITQVTPIDVVFAAPQGDLPRIQARLQKGPPPQATAWDPSRTRMLAQGSFLTLDNVVDATTGTIKAKARFANTDGSLFPSQFVNIRILLDNETGVVTVPAAAVRTGPNGDFVYVVTPQRKAALRAVTRGPANGDTVAIARGVTAGDKVVIAGGDQLTDGAAVQLGGDHAGAGDTGQPRSRRAGR